MKYVYVLLFFLSASFTYGQKQSEINLIKERISLSDKSVYIFCRGTKSKAGIVAREFNVTDTVITHTGLGFVKGDKIFIYNVSDNKNTFESALIIDSLESFIGSDDVHYLGVWKCDINYKELLIAEKICTNYHNRKITFDRMFEISNDDTLYCSEFYELTLKQVNPVKFYFKPVAIEIKDPLMGAVLKRKNLVYFPVDFFLGNKYCHRIFSYKFNE